MVTLTYDGNTTALLRVSGVTVMSEDIKTALKSLDVLKGERLKLMFLLRIIMTVIVFKIEIEGVTQPRTLTIAKTAESSAAMTVSAVKLLDSNAGTVQDIVFSGDGGTFQLSTVNQQQTTWVGMLRTKWFDKHSTVC